MAFTYLHNDLLFENKKNDVKFVPARWILHTALRTFIQAVHNLQTVINKLVLLARPSVNMSLSKWLTAVRRTWQYVTTVFN